MRRFLSRSLGIIPVMLGISVLVFFGMRLTPGDPVDIMTGQTAISAEQRDQLRHQLGLDKPLLVQFVDFLWKTVHGDLGTSIRYKIPVTKLILFQAPSTVELAVAAMAFAVAFGGLAGLVAAFYQNRIADHVIMVFALIGLCMPSFWLGLLLIIFFSVRLGWLPSSGSGGLDYLVLPAFALGLIYASTIARLTRSSMIEILSQDFIRTARAKGLSERKVVLRHALKNALIPIVTVGGLQLGYLLGGAVIVENVFARQGLGNMTVNAILDKDYPVIQGTVLFICVCIVFINLLVDLLYLFLDPRVKEV
jgi:peptide/nickel transport system permease protein